MSPARGCPDVRVGQLRAPSHQRVGKNLGAARTFGHDAQRSIDRVRPGLVPQLLEGVDQLILVDAITSTLAFSCHAARTVEHRWR